METLTARRAPKNTRPGELEEIKRIPILAVAKELGIALRNGSCRCPLPGHDDRSPSFLVNAITNTWRCYACDVSGSVIDLVMRMNDWDFGRSVAWIRARYLSGGTVLRPTLNRRARVNQGGSVVNADYRPDPELYGWVMERCPLGPEGIAYFDGRAISEATLRAFRSGQVSDRAHLAESTVAAFGFVRVQAAGLLTKRSSPCRPVCVFPSGSVVFPFLRAGECQYLQARLIIGSGARRWINLSGIHSPTFNADVLDNPSAVNVVLCEGISDTLSAAEMGRNAIGLLGAGASFSDEDAALLRRKDVYVVADRDKAGQRMGTRLHGQLARLGVRPTVQRLPEGCGDLNEYLVRYRKGKR